MALGGATGGAWPPDAALVDEAGDCDVVGAAADVGAEAVLVDAATTGSAVLDDIEPAPPHPANASRQKAQKARGNGARGTERISQF